MTQALHDRLAQTTSRETETWNICSDLMAEWIAHVEAHVDALVRNDYAAMQVESERAHRAEAAYEIARSDWLAACDERDAAWAESMAWRDRL